MKLRQWYQVHCRAEDCPTPAAMSACFKPQIAGHCATFDRSDGQWRDGQLEWEGEAALMLERFFPGDPEFLIRNDELWWQELQLPGEVHADAIIEHLRQTRYTVAMMPMPFSLGPSRLARLCEQLCGFLAREADGMIHVFQEGFFNVAGESLLPRNPKHRLKTQ